MSDQSKPERLRFLADDLDAWELGEEGFAASAALREYAALLERPQEAREPRSDVVDIPKNEDQATLMVLLGTSWLEQNAPHRLRSAPHEPTGWQPIETAPKKGKFMVWIPATDLAWPAYAAGDWIYSNSHGALNEMQDGRVLKATHWMPIPSAPVTKGEMQ